MKTTYFNRQYIEEFFAILYLFLSYFLFIDNFDVYRNIYRALKTFYLILACLLYKKRRKVVNVFTLTLEFYETNLKTIVKVFFKSIKQLNRDIKDMQINRKSTSIYVFTIELIEDMSQQVDNSGFARHNVTIRCCSCFCSKLKRENLAFDIVNQDR